MPSKILYVGSFRRDYYDAKLSLTFKKAGIDVHEFAWKKYFSDFNYTNFFHALVFGTQNRYKVGPAISQLNNDLISKACILQPDCIFINRGLHILPKTLIEIRQKCRSTKLIGYNNDSPFSSLHPWWLFRLHLKSVRHFDHFFCYRESDKPEYQKLGCLNTEVLYPYYIASDNYKIASATKRFDVSFIGHFEDDGRDHSINHLLNNNIRINLQGTDWQRSDVYSEISSRANQPFPIYGSEYNKQLNESKICLVFLSKINNDRYTRRCLEIPAAGSFMLSEFTSELDNWFKEGVEAEYFRDRDELLDKTRFYLCNESARERIALAGYNKLHSTKHEISDRVRQIVRKI